MTLWLHAERLFWRAVGDLRRLGARKGADRNGVLQHAHRGLSRYEGHCRDRTASTGRPKSVATLEYELIAGAPCTHTHEDVQFAVHLARTRASTLLGADAPSISRAEFFSKSHACMRASALPKTYGWGLHFDDHGRVALVGVETDRYRQLASDPSLTHMPAMRSKRA